MTKFLLDFNDLSTGAIVGDQYLGRGVTISSANAKYPPMIVDANNPSGNDDDPASVATGKVLIISENGAPSDPDDTHGGGTLRFDFGNAAEVHSLRVLDLECGGEVRLFDENGALLKTVGIGGTPDAGTNLVEIDCAGVHAMEVWFPEGGAIDDVSYSIGPALAPDGIVEGSEDDDLIDLSYDGDPQGDRIDNGDAILPGEGPDDDIVYAGAGDDTVLGGAGDDEIWGDRALLAPSPVLITIDASLAAFENQLFAYTLDPVTGEVTNLELLSENAKADIGKTFTYPAEPGAVFGLGIVSPKGTFFSSAYGENVDLNSDGVVHTRPLGVNPDGSVTIGFEDLRNLGDADFNDVIVTVDLGTSGAIFDNAHFDYSSQAPDGVDDSAAGDDRLYGGEGDDEIHGGGGNDLIDGGPGADTLLGDAGRDVVTGGEGADIIDGGADTDLLVGNAGDDIIEGGDGADLIGGGDGDDVLWGDSAGDTDAIGDDIIFGGAGDDEIHGGGGDDTIVGGEGGDLQEGGEGDDLFVEVDAGDHVVGGEGNDTLVLSGPAIIEYDDPADKTSGTINFLEPGSATPVGSATFEGIETLTYVIPEPDPVPPSEAPTETRSAPDMTLPSLDGVVDGTAGNDLMDDAYTGDPEGDMIDDGVSLPGLGPDDDVIRGFDGDDLIYAGRGNDYVLAGAGDDVVEGGAGDDKIRGEEGDDTLAGGEGNDQIRGDDGHDTLGGGIGDDVLVGGLGNDVIDGGDGDDVLVGGDADDPDHPTSDPGDDVLSGGEGRDILFGDAGDDTLRMGDDGSGADGDADVAFGGADRDTFLEVGAGDVIFGGESGDDYDTIDLTGRGPLKVDWTGGDPSTESGVITFFDAPGGNVTGTATFSEIENVVPCFTPGTRVTTPAGEKPVEQLRVGDRVITRDNGVRQIRWYGEKRLGLGGLAAVSHLQPVMIRAGSLGNGLPVRDMLVSPNHRMLVAGNRPALYFAETEVLVAAKHLVGWPGVLRVEHRTVTYIHFMFDRHEVVLADGAWTESFQPGDYTLRGIDGGQREEIFEIFPELATADGVGNYAAARRTLKRHEAALLRH